MNNDIFVFGSNEGGKHGKGSAFEAFRYWGAEMGVGVGPTGRAYAIPTKTDNLRVLPLARIRIYVERFLRYAQGHPELNFKCVAVGCGEAGYAPKQIAPLFAKHTGNVKLPPEFRDELRRLKEVQRLQSITNSRP